MSPFLTQRTKSKIVFYRPGKSAETQEVCSLAYKAASFGSMAGRSTASCGRASGGGARSSADGQAAAAAPLPACGGILALRHGDLHGVAPGRGRGGPRGRGEAARAPDGDVRRRGSSTARRKRSAVAGGRGGGRRLEGAGWKEGQ
uniref:Uncharacterized protein n=1 Tax=Setaria viridis TaxID=4556 RepID=A0A4U6UI80_SETVI|nr:hypothetical protein SEVIR_5G103460v2 [Setaria viridis]